MRRGLTLADLYDFQEQAKQRPGICPVCGRPLEYNPRTGKHGQWAHFIRNTKFHESRYGRLVIDSPLNGVKVCSLRCNNAVQLTYATQSVLCDKLAKRIADEA